MQIFQSKSDANLPRDFLKTILLVDSFYILFCVAGVFQWRTGCQYVRTTLYNWTRLGEGNSGWIIINFRLLYIPPFISSIFTFICNGFNKVTITSKIKRRNTAELAFNLVKRTHLLLCPLSRYSCLRPLPDNPKYCLATTSFFFHFATSNLLLQIENNVLLRIALYLPGLVNVHL